MKLHGRNLSNGTQGDDIRLLHQKLGLLGFHIPEAESHSSLFGPGTLVAVRELQKRAGLKVTGIVNRATNRAINEQLGNLPTAGKGEQEPPSRLAASGLDAAAAASATCNVTGTVTSPDSAAVDRLRVQIVAKHAGPGDDVVLASADTDARGRYQVNVPVTAGNLQPDLQARVLRDETAVKILGASKVCYNAGSQETLDVHLPANLAELPSELETLLSALKKHYTGDLRLLEESDARQDITYLANKCGWDARAVAMSALADKLYHEIQGQDPSGHLSPAFYYALVRAGLPADSNRLYQIDAETVGEIWQKASDQGVIPQASKDEISSAKNLFQSLAASRVLDSRAVSGTSTFKEMARLVLGDDVESHEKFAKLYTRYRGNPKTFWEETAKPPAEGGKGGFGPDVAKRLQAGGQLASLTLNNAPLMDRLRRTVSSPPDLVQGGFHRAAAWEQLLGDEVPLPEQIPGGSKEDKRANYAECMAAGVRLSFPMSVIAERIRSGEIEIIPDTVKPEVIAFLIQPHGAKQEMFELGKEPVEQFLERLSLTLVPKVLEQIKRLQRVYQITPTDEAMVALLKANLDSAYRVVRYEEEEFVRTFQDELGGEEKARLTYAKAQQVHNTVLNLAVSYLAARNAPGLGVGGDGATQAATLSADTTGVIAYPTLENLFGSMDFCACEHCRSVLSPAAYLVDLLQFLGPQVVQEKRKPLEVLLARRPDIEHLPLSCENTNTPLPYIDLVNETLEYFIAHNLALTGYTGHDTGSGVSPEDLLANPQFVEEKAYEEVKKALFPSLLPFHKPLETLRRYFDKLEAPLREAMERLRRDDAVERPNNAGYGWRDVLMEELRLSRKEEELLTGSKLTLVEIYGFPASTTEADALKELAKAKTLSRRVGITSEELIELLATRFINPNSWLIPRLERLGVSFSTIKDFKDGKITETAFKALLPPGLDLAPYGGDAVKWVRDNYARIMRLITLVDLAAKPDPCNFDFVELRYSDPSPAANVLPVIEYVRLLRFLRLWKKLGLTIEQTDELITALLPAGATSLSELDSAFKTLLPRLGVLFQVMDRLQLTPGRDLQALLACWAPIGTHGPNALYRKMFLSPALLRLDPVFAEDSSGSFLQDSSQKLRLHTEALRAAFGLTGEELSWIDADLEFGDDTGLTLNNLSEVYRRAWLARTLRLSVRELLLLIDCTGFDPFAALDPPNAPAPPYAPIVRFLDLLEALRATSLKPVQALYLLWNEDVSGKSVPENRQILDLARNLRAGFAAVESELAVTGSPEAQAARARMAQVYSGEVTDFFFGLLEGTLRFEVSYDHSGETLEDAILAVAKGRLTYDDLRKSLSYAGALDPATSTDLRNVSGVSEGFKTAIEALRTRSDAATRSFFERHGELQPLYSAYAASTESPETRRESLLRALLRDLKKSRKRQQALAVVSTAMRTDLSLAQALLTDAAVLHAAADAGNSALEDLLALEIPGLAGVPSVGVWGGYLEAPQNGSCNVRIETDGQPVTLHVDGVDVKPEKETGRNVWSNTERIDLTAGTLHRIEISIKNGTRQPVIGWKTEGRGWEVIPEKHLYDFAVVDRLRSTAIRFLKASSLSTALKMTALEIVHFATRNEYKIEGKGWLDALAVSGRPDVVMSRNLRDRLMALLDFADLKAELSPEDERLLSVLSSPGAVLADGKSLLLSLTGWEERSLDTLLKHFGNKTRGDLARVDFFRRVHDAYAVVKKLGVPASALLQAVTNEPAAEAVHGLQSALRARYGESDWRAVIRPINDEMRGLQRDALVAHILKKMGESAGTRHIDTPDKLFEYFLMDVEMEPCMQTSRIRNALSSVQLFTDRCLMNLEPEVAPSSINARQWEWMKRYRVWEANRKVFLWPENWLEPELRDDQSPFFKEAMSELLQGDITEDRAATALLNYLSKLDEVAKLEPCGIHYAENQPGTADDVAHVVARTAGARRKYYYRRREGISWTPWEQVQIGIDDNPVIPVVWQGRLLLFWLKILKQGPAEPSILGSGGDGYLSNVKKSDVKAQETQVTHQGVLCWSEYYNGTWQPARTSDIHRPIDLGQFDPADTFPQSQLGLSTLEKGNELWIFPGGQWYGRSLFRLYNTQSLPPVGWSFDLPEVLRGPDSRVLLTTEEGTFRIEYIQVTLSEDVTHVHTRDLLKSPIPSRVVRPGHRLQKVWDAPFFFEDGRHVFYVTTVEKLVTILESVRFGVGLPLAYPAEIPPLAMTPPAVVPERYDPMLGGLNFSVADPSIERFVRKDPHIRTCLGVGASIRYGKREIGPAGGVSSRRSPRR